MNKRVILALALSFAWTTSASASDDKMLHLGATTAISSITHQYLTKNKENLVNQTVEQKRIKMIQSMTLCAGVGAGKELYDDVSGGDASGKDLAYDMVGCMFGTSLSASFNEVYIDTKFDFDQDGDLITMLNFNYDF